MPNLYRDMHSLHMFILVISIASWSTIPESLDIDKRDSPVEAPVPSLRSELIWTISTSIKSRGYFFHLPGLAMGSGYDLMT